MSTEQIAAYALIATLVCTALHKIVDALRPIAAATASKRDDQALDFVDTYLGYASSALGFISLHVPKNAPKS